MRSERNVLIRQIYGHKLISNLAALEKGSAAQVQIVFVVNTVYMAQTYQYIHN
jgi:hypothetical protein